MLLNLNQWFGLNTRWPFSNYVSRMPGLDKYLVSSQKWEHYKLYLVPYCCFNSISVFHQQGSSHSLGYEIYQLYHEKSQYFNWLKLLQFFCFMICPGDGQSSSSRKWSEHHVSGHCPTLSTPPHRGRRPPWSVLIFTDTDIWVTADNSCLSLNDVLIMSLRYVSVF